MRNGDQFPSSRNAGSVCSTAAGKCRTPAQPRPHRRPARPSVAPAGTRVEAPAESARPRPRRRGRNGRCHRRCLARTTSNPGPRPASRQHADAPTSVAGRAIGRKRHPPVVVTADSGAPAIVCSNAANAGGADRSARQHGIAFRPHLTHARPAPPRSCASSSARCRAATTRPRNQRARVAAPSPSRSRPQPRAAAPEAPPDRCSTDPPPMSTPAAPAACAQPARRHSQQRPQQRAAPTGLHQCRHARQSRPARCRRARASARSPPDRPRGARAADAGCPPRTGRDSGRVTAPPARVPPAPSPRARPGSGQHPRRDAPRAQPSRDAAAASARRLPPAAHDPRSGRSAAHRAPAPRRRPAAPAPCCRPRPKPRRPAAAPARMAQAQPSTPQIPRHRPGAPCSTGTFGPRHCSLTTA